jgi:hypothetical protein
MIADYKQRVAARPKWGPLEFAESDTAGEDTAAAGEDVAGSGEDPVDDGSGVGPPDARAALRAKLAEFVTPLSLSVSLVLCS